MNSKASPSNIVRAHYRSLYDSRDPSKKLYWKDLLTLWGLPLLIGIIAGTTGWEPNTTVILALALFCGSTMFVAALAVMTVTARLKVGSDSLTRETFSNLLYGVLVGVFLALFCLFFVSEPWSRIVFAVDAAVLAHLLLTFSMCLKRLWSINKNFMRQR